MWTFSRDCQLCRIGARSLVITTVTFYLTHQNLLVILSARGGKPGVRKAKIIKKQRIIVKVRSVVLMETNKMRDLSWGGSQGAG